MRESDKQNAAFIWSTTFVRSLFEEGVRHAVISPGSRSTPLTLAFAVHPGFKKHVIIDERSAAFTALGIAKASGNPAILICTSGTAVANYFPAVVEATQSGIPLIIASADRPPHSRGLGASQTIDQVKIFGDYPVFFHEVGEPLSTDLSIHRIKLAAKQAVLYSKSKGGVSHLNFPFTKPFEPNEDLLIQTEKENKIHSKNVYSPYISDMGKMELDEIFWSDLISSERPVIIVGPTGTNDDLSFISDLAKVLKAPILAEPGSNIPAGKNTIIGFDGFLRNQTNQDFLKPDLILRFGTQPVSKALNLYLENFKDALQISFMSDILWADGSLSSHKQIMLKAPISIPKISGSAEKNWLKSWKNVEKNFQDFRKKVISAPTLSDGYVFSNITPFIPKKAFIMLSNSFPVRDMSMFGDFSGREIHVNRGAAGIDGITSTAIGLSIEHQKTGVLFIGDIAFLHDSNALLNAKLVDKPLIIILLNNGGGTIFRMLPIHSIREKYEPYFETPQDTNVAALCRAHKINHVLISKPEQLVKAFERVSNKNGVHVLECVTNADISMEQRKKLWDFEYQEEEKNG